MPPKVKFKKEEVIGAALNIARDRGAEFITAREVARELGVSVGPIFTYFDTMDQLKNEVYATAEKIYRDYLEQGLKESIPFLGVWHMYIKFAKEERRLYKMLFLTAPGSTSGGAMKFMRFSQELVRPSIMRIYNMDADTADSFFRDIWLVAFSFATLIVMGESNFTDEEIFAIGTEISLSVCKAYKEIPGLPQGVFDRDAIFQELVKK